MDFRWIDWNILKVQKHGVTPAEAEYVARHAHSPFRELLIIFRVNYLLATACHPERNNPCSVILSCASNLASMHPLDERFEL